MLLTKENFKEVLKMLVIRNPHIVQLGAHLAEEHHIWSELEAKRIDYVEALPDLTEILQEQFKNTENVNIWNFVLGDSNIETSFRKSSPTFISSKLDLTHAALSQNQDFLQGENIILNQISLDHLINELIGIRPDILVLDVQGSEFEILAASTDLTIPIIVTELLYEDLYIKQAEGHEVRYFLESVGYSLIYESFDISMKWSDGIFIYDN
jgi:FkbM family methyltransferase